MSEVVSTSLSFIILALIINHRFIDCVSCLMAYITNLINAYILRQNNNKFYYYYLPAIILLLIVNSLPAQSPKPLLPVEIVEGKLVYNPDPTTGDRVPDYSYCGYKASEQEIPMVPVKVLVPLVQGDATATIQAAIDKVASLPLDQNGFRGAVLLSNGVYEVMGQLHIHQSGIVLRGQGQTSLLGKGIDRDGLIRVFGKEDISIQNQTTIIDEYVPVGATSFLVNNASDFKVGDQVFIKRPSVKEWIDELGTESFGGGISALGWKPGDVDIRFDRKIVALEENKVTIDVPLTTSLDKKYGGGLLTKYAWPGRIQNIGIENLLLLSDFDKANPKDENHRWMAITLDNVEDAWVRQVTFKHFAGSAVYINETVRRVTIEDCIAIEPISEIGGQRRNTFFTRGQQTLFQRCYSANGYHDFSVGYTAAGPNAFVQCVAERPYSFSGTIGRWASGVLFDIVEIDGNAIRFGNRGQDGHGAGWSGANCFLWNCSASLIECDRPPTAQNWSYGSWSEFAGKGFWTESNNHLKPRSFFYAQLAQRLNRDVSRQAAILHISTEASTSPTVEAALQLTEAASQPRVRLLDWIATASQRNPINTEHKNAIIISPQRKTENDSIAGAGVIVKNGWLVSQKSGIILTGKVQNIPWWSGGIEGKALEQARRKPAITRFVPGRVGPGLTDDLNAVIDSMKANNVVALNQHYGLWYDRRRDDHERIRRMNGDVWPPFYELPFARSGRDTAWDGLSKYDLTKYNEWYWARMQQFASLAEKNDLLLIHHHYFQHNIIEAGAHYADFPWRTANNINNTGFVEPVNYAGDKRIFYAEQFYDTTHYVRRQLHQQYIWKCLDNFRNNKAVIQLLSEEYTGPLHFTQFWLNVIAAWEKRNQQKQIIGLSATKDVQDAILNDLKYRSLIDVIDIKYWHYQPDGSLYAPEGGKSLAPRQWARLLKPKAANFDQAYRAVREYKDKFPDKVVTFSADGYDKLGWAVFMAGGSLPALPRETDKNFLKAAVDMKPTDAYGKYALAGENDIILYIESAKELALDLSAFKGSFSLRFVDVHTGKVISAPKQITAGRTHPVIIPKKPLIVWLSKK